MENKSKRDTKSIGDRSEAMVLVALVEAGYDIWMPFGENHRYDFIADKGGVLSRIQVKTGRLHKGVIVANLFSVHRTNNKATIRRYLGEIDCFAIYCLQTGGVYLVPVAQTAQRLHLRTERPKNGQKKLLKWADEFIVSGSRPVEGGEPAVGVTLEALDPPL